MLDFSQSRELSSVKIYVFADGKTYTAPDSISLEYESKGQWLPVKIKELNPASPRGNTVNTILFEKIIANRIRIHFKHETMAVAISEIECY